MNSKQLFFFSLILLSVAMGMNWFKNRPKTKPVKSNRPRVALNLSDLQLQDEGTQTETSTETDTASGTGAGETTGEGEEPVEGDTATATGEGTETASAPTDIASGTLDASDPLTSDPIITALKAMPRNPFETSPYAQLVEQLRMASEVSDEPVAKKTVTLLQAEFSATIQTPRELVAVIDKRLFRQGEAFQDKTITEIKTEYVALESESGIFLLPKTGVNISIAEDGTYTVNDSFHKK